MNRRHSSLLPFLVLTVGLAVLPACSSSASGVRGDGQGLGARIADRFAYRPVYAQPNPVPGTRPLFLSGYAGARYGNAPIVPVNPTTYQVVPNRWFEWLHGAH
jgi:hypothetical protein